MKKRNIIIISVSVITLLFGGLVSLAINTFPDLIEVEKEEIEQSPKDVLFEAPSLNGINDKNEEVGLTSIPGQTATHISRYGDISAPISRHTHKGETDIISHSEVNFISPSKSKTSFQIDAHDVSDGHSSSYRGYYVSNSGSSYEKSYEPTLYKETKEERINTEVDSNAIMNTTLMAIGLCEVLSFILVMKRKRHLRLR